MSTIKKTIGLDKIGIDSLSMPEKDKEYFRKLVNQLERLHIEVRQQAESSSITLISPDGYWKILINGNNLEFQRKESGAWNKKGAITA